MSTQPAVTTTQLQALFKVIFLRKGIAIALTTQEQTLHQDITAQIGQYFRANRCKLFYNDELLSATGKVPALLRKALSLEENPVLRYLTERHTAVHDEIVLPPGVWKTICPRADHALVDDRTHHPPGKAHRRPCLHPPSSRPSVQRRRPGRLECPVPTRLYANSNIADTVGKASLPHQKLTHPSRTRDC